MCEIVERGFEMGIDEAFTVFPELNTKRLRLRQMELNDADAYFEIKSDSEIMDFYGDEAHQSVEETRSLIAELRGAYEQRQAILWGVTLKGEEKVIGTCVLMSFGPGFHYAEIGYEVHRAYWRQGIMSEALDAMLTYGFEELGLHRIEAAMDGRNERSKNLLLKLGFTYEGNLRQRFAFRDQFLDAHYYGLLKNEWIKS